MPGEKRRQPIGDGDELTRLIREAGLVGDTTYQRPSDDTVRAYLLGNATANQKHEVRAALIASSEFRNEIAQLAEELEKFPAGLFTESTSPEVQSSPLAMKRRAKLEGSFVDKILGWLNRFLAPLSSPQWATAGAAAVVLLTVSLTYLMRGGDYIDVQPYLVSNSVETEVLRSIKPRSTNQTQSQGFPTSSDAAMDAFRGILEYQSGQFTVQPNDRLVRTDGDRQVSLRITGRENTETVFGAMLGAGTTASAANLEAWILILPDRALYRVPMTSDAVGVKLESSPSQQFVVALTWQISDLHYSTIASSN